MAVKRDRSWLVRLIDHPANIGARNALLWGVAWLIVGSMVGWYFRLVPTSLVGYNVSGYVPLIWVVLFNLVIWIVSAVPLFTVAVIRNRKTGVEELFGRVLYAHWPVNLLMVPALFRGQRVAYASFMADPAQAIAVDPLYGWLMAVLCGVVVMWYLYWCYVAFSAACKRSGVVNVLLYLVVMVVVWMLTDVVMAAMSGVVAG